MLLSRRETFLEGSLPSFFSPQQLPKTPFRFYNKSGKLQRIKDQVLFCHLYCLKERGQLQGGSKVWNVDQEKRVRTGQKGIRWTQQRCMWKNEMRVASNSLKPRRQTLRLLAKETKPFREVLHTGPKTKTSCCRTLWLRGIQNSNWANERWVINPDLWAPGSSVGRYNLIF